MRLFFVLLSFISIAQARIIVVSDIDDTIKVTQGVSIETLTEYIKGESYAYPEMNILYNELKKLGADFFYLSSSYKNIYDASKWIYEKDFPEGTVIQRDEDSALDGRYFKKDELKKFLKKQKPTPEDKILLFGDNLGNDDEVYSSVISELQLEKISRIYIRDMVMNQALPAVENKWPPHLFVRYFLSENDFADLYFGEFFGQIPLPVVFKISGSYYSRKSLGNFQRNLLQKKIEDRHCRATDIDCIRKIGSRYIDLLNDYYHF